MVAYEKRDQMSTYMRNKVDDIHAWYTEGPQGRIKYLKQMIDIDDQDPHPHGSLGNSYRLLGQYDKAIPEFEKFLDILKKWGIKPPVTYYSTYLSESYHKIGNYKKERKLYKDGEKLFPENPVIKYRQAILSLTEEDTIEANRFIEKYKSICKENSLSEVEIAYGVASIYYLADKFDKAEKYYRQILSLEPENPNMMNNLGWLLIETNRNINEGLLLFDKALALKPDNYEFMEIKGWGLYKAGKYKEALEILQKSWDLRMKNAIYSHPAYLHLEEAKKAVVGQKN
jgi:tetratricopeptide (TPR) repeat protein